MKKIQLKVDGMTCSACSSGLEKYLLKQTGIFSASVNLILGMVTIECDDLSIAQLQKYISQAGFSSPGEYSYTDDSKVYKVEKRNLFIFGILLILLMYVSMGHMLSLPEVFSYTEYPVFYGLILLVISFLFLIYGLDILKSGFLNLIHRMPNMDTLVLFSVFFSFSYSIYGFIQICFGNTLFLHELYFESVTMVIYFVKLGRFIENISKNKSTSAICNLVTITPKKAVMKKGDDLVSVTLDEIREDDVLVCRPQEKFAVDGEVVQGESYADEAFITGESVPVLKKKGSTVLAGSMNYDGVVEYKAKRIGKESMVSSIVSMVVESLGKKNKIEKVADKISSYFVPFIFIVAVVAFVIKLLLGFGFAFSFHTFVTVLVIACPCALGLAVPLVISVSYGLCAKKGIVVKSGDVLEEMRRVDRVVFDKTGTLTYGKLQVYQVFSYHDSSYSILRVVGSLESFSTHPIASAFSKENLLSVSDFSDVPGMGIKGVIDSEHYYVGNKKLLKELGISDFHEKDYKKLVSAGCSILYLVKEKEVVGLLGVRDTVRPDMKNIISHLEKLGITTVMLTGDNLDTARIIAKELGISEIHADVLPKDKASIIQGFVAAGNKVVMVGDGVNDAVALVGADVGISISDGTDVASDASDVILMNHNLSNLLDFIDISRKSNHIIKENLFWAFFYNVCMIPVAAGLLEPFGIVLNPMLASIFMTISSLTVVFNSLRLRWMVK
ncbi:MAG TPA: cation-translocating P-type ATPase [Candidatus Faecimonas gallistercoris]|nr:cation-translocating P-type ATPase [Candidatus Faecimonas gallistercoris]